MSCIPVDEGNQECIQCKYFYVALGCVPTHKKYGQPPCGRQIEKEGDYMQEKARQIVRDYFNSHVDVTDGVQISMEDVYVVWFSKTLQNWKALVSTTVPDNKYYELTYNGDKGETYVDVYVKLDNQVVKD